MLGHAIGLFDIKFCPFHNQMAFFLPFFYSNFQIILIYFKVNAQKKLGFYLKRKLSTKKQSKRKMDFPIQVCLLFGEEDGLEHSLITI